MTHSKALTWSRSPKFPFAELSWRVRNPKGPRRYWTVTITTSSNEDIIHSWWGVDDVCRDPPWIQTITWFIYDGLITIKESETYRKMLRWCWRINWSEDINCETVFWERSLRWKEELLDWVFSKSSKPLFILNFKSSEIRNRFFILTYLTCWHKGTFSSLASLTSSHFQGLTAGRNRNA